MCISKKLDVAVVRSIEIQQQHALLWANFQAQCIQQAMCCCIRLWTTSMKGQRFRHGPQVWLGILRQGTWSETMDKTKGFGTKWFYHQVSSGETRMNDNQPCLRPCSWKTRHGDRLLGCFWGGEYLWTYVTIGVHKRNNFQLSWCNFSQSSWMKQLWCKPGSLHCISSRANAAGCLDMAFCWVSWECRHEEILKPSQHATATATVSFPKDQRIAPSTTSHQCNGKATFQETWARNSRPKIILEWWTARCSTL